MRRRWSLFVVSIFLGAAISAIGFRLTSEVLVVLGLAAAAAFTLAAISGDRPWLWGLGVGIGTRLFPEPALSAAHQAKYGPAQHLPLPFGLTGHAFAERLVGLLLIVAIPVIGAYLGWLARKLGDAVTHPVLH